MPLDKRPYMIRFASGTRADIESTSKKIDLSFPETVRQAVTFGLPVVEARLKKPGRKK